MFILSSLLVWVRASKYNEINSLSGILLLQNAWRFGFILRYPKGTQDITGFKDEYWHFRYVGREVALKMHDDGIVTLEEYHQRKRSR
ncbi:MAG: D-alanyl-D-alanine carboxypeptidase family protein [Bacilli bacterium]|nr:D-alanyl-D-alanine carboxypeptidase family protein [Bacilli bacterium]